MKNTIFLTLAAAVLGVSAQAQSTVDSIHAKYQLLPMPAAMTQEEAFPVLGMYTLNGQTQETTTPITVTMDANSKGIVWIDGLPQGRVKAYLKKSPATYRIVAQKTASGASVPEGTLIYSPDSHVLNIALGKAYDEQEPASVFASLAPATATADVAGTTEVKTKSKSSSAKSKSKLVLYSATKNEQTAAVETPANPVPAQKTTPEPETQQ